MNLRLLDVTRIDIDIMIGEREAAGRGVGSAVLRLVAQTVPTGPGTA